MKGEVDHTPAVFVLDQQGRKAKLYMTQMSYAAVGQLGQVLAQEVSGLLPGHPYQVSALFTALLTISANDAAIALTQAVGSYGQGMALINAEARHLQADDTVAVDPNGLDAPGQHTSAYDLALFARQALGMPAFLTYD